jgi:hypothetical protein
LQDSKKENGGTDLTQIFQEESPEQQAIPKSKAEKKKEKKRLERKR